MKRAVLDTNVLVSGLLSPHGPPAALLNKVAADNLSPVYSDPIFEEYAEVLIRPCLHLDPDAVLRWLALFGDVAEYVSPSVTTHPPVILRAAKRSRRIQRLDSATPPDGSAQNDSNEKSSCAEGGEQLPPSNDCSAGIDRAEFPDLDDLPFYAAALAAHCALVTGNRKHFPNNGPVAVLSPAEFIHAAGDR